MWLIQTLSETLSNIVAFSLAMHNANANLTMRDFMAAFSPPKEK